MTPEVSELLSLDVYRDDVQWSNPTGHLGWLFYHLNEVSGRIRPLQSNYSGQVLRARCKT